MVVMSRQNRADIAGFKHIVEFIGFLQPSIALGNRGRRNRRVMSNQKCAMWCWFGQHLCEPIVLFGGQMAIKSAHAMGVYTDDSSPVNVMECMTGVCGGRECGGVRFETDALGW